jgi:hypothetical protein
MPHQLIDHLNTDWQRAAANVREAATQLWKAPSHRHAIDHGPLHADRVVGLLGGLTEGLIKEE